MKKHIREEEFEEEFEKRIKMLTDEDLLELLKFIESFQENKDQSQEEPKTKGGD